MVEVVGIEYCVVFVFGNECVDLVGEFVYVVGGGDDWIGVILQQVGDVWYVLFGFWMQVVLVFGIEVVVMQFDEVRV